jgi:hypothetical protein
LERPAIDAALANFRTAPIAESLKETLVFLEAMHAAPDGTNSRKC